MVPQELKYTDSHEWVKTEGNTATIGITHHAQEQLTDIVFVELPEEGNAYSKGAECGVIESTKIAAELYAPISGKIVETNKELETNPALINEEPYEGGWIFKMELDDASELESLLDADAYRPLTE
ncbi:glycine cleavage system protein GcvH [bacterium]|nr:glycine cleavage system protein GcvH [bacterium]